MFELEPRSAGAWRVAPDATQIVGRIVGMLDMPVSANVMHIAGLVQDQRAIAPLVIKDAGFDLEPQRRRRFESLHEYGARQILETARQKPVIAEPPQRRGEGKAVPDVAEIERHDTPASVRRGITQGMLEGVIPGPDPYQQGFGVGFQQGAAFLHEAGAMEFPVVLEMEYVGRVDHAIEPVDQL